MTEFKKGDKVRRTHADTIAWRGMPAGTEAEVLGFNNSGMVLNGWGDGHEPSYFKLVTPALLDPSKVKAGDTVTLESGTALVRDVVIEAKSRGVGQFVFYTAENPDPLIPGTYYLVNSGAWTLTDHQPAPEPEKDLLAETIWLASRADEGTISATGADHVAAAIRNLFTVINPVEVDVDGLKRVLAIADYDYQAQADAALKFLGIKENSND